MTRLLAIADSDSYLKWSQATLARLPAGWTAQQVVINNPLRPSEAQAGENSHVLGLRAVHRLVRRSSPDVVLLACTGPVVATLAAASALREPNRPVVVTGLPGISIPASPLAVRLRTGCDLLLVHSRWELAEFRRLADGLAPGLAVGLARLPFLAGTRLSGGPAGGDLIFAAQARVPASRSEREQILLALAEADSAVVKLRAGDREQQTHRERWPYPGLYADLVRQGRIPPEALRFARGPMSEALSGARGLVTVSSTAALEAMAAGLPSMIISDFGVSAAMINLVFADSGCLGSLDDLRHGRLAHPDPAWASENYFHPDADNTWLTEIERLVELRAAGSLPIRPMSSASLPARVRRRLRLAVPARLWQRLPSRKH